MYICRYVGFRVAVHHPMFTKEAFSSFRALVLLTSLCVLVIAAFFSDHLPFSLFDRIKLWHQSDTNLNVTAARSVCEAIAVAVSSASSVYYPGELNATSFRPY